MSYPTHLPTVQGRRPDPYWRARQELELLADAQARYGRWLDHERSKTRPPVASHASERKLLSRLAYGLLGVVIAVEVLFAVWGLLG